MPSIHPTKTGGFRVYYLQAGKQRNSPVQPSREAAEAWMLEHCAAQAARTIIELAHLWEAEDPTPHRAEAATRIVAAARARGWGSVGSIAGSELTAWQRTASPRYGQYVATLLRWAAKQHHLAVRADALAWRPTKYRRQAPVPLLTDAQARAIRAAARRYGAAAAALIDYLLTYGARPITACRLRRCDLDVARGELVISDAKHSGGWRHALRDGDIETWRKLGKDPDGPLFPCPKPDEQGRPRAWRIERGSARELCDWYRNTIAKRLKLGRQDGIYHLKRYSITRMLRSGVDPATVALFSGHLDLSQVLRYAKSNSDLQRAALALLPHCTNHCTIARKRAVTPVTP